VEDFILGKPLGKGKFGNVYLGKQKLSNALVALKVLFKAPMLASKCVNNLRREVEIQYRLKHKNIVQLFGYFDDSKNVYLILEYLEKGELYKQIAKAGTGYVSEDVCRGYMLDVIAAVSHMHERHIWHRDLKPENILIGSCSSEFLHSSSSSSTSRSSSGGGTSGIRLCIGDFGWAVHAPPPKQQV